MLHLLLNNTGRNYHLFVWWSFSLLCACLFLCLIHYSCLIFLECCPYRVDRMPCYVLCRYGRAVRRLLTFRDTFARLGHGEKVHSAFFPFFLVLSV